MNGITFLISFSACLLKNDPNIKWRLSGGREANRSREKSGESAGVVSMIEIIYMHV
jgi:hypothetical protein